MINPGIAYFVKVHPDATIPSYKSTNAACCDIYMPTNNQLRPLECKLIPTGLISIPPKDWHWHIYMRSSTAIQYPDLVLRNYVDIVDGDYTGPKDQIKLLLLNQSPYITLELKKNDRMVQMRLV